MPQILFHGTGSAKKDSILIISIGAFVISTIAFLAIYGEKIGVKSEGDIRGIWSILMLVFLIGAYTFFEGFRTFRTKQFIEGTATSKIRALAIGFAEVYGKITPLKILKSPISNNDCAYWRVIIMGGAETGVLKHDKSSAEGFLVKDETGSILVDPKDAQFERLSVGLSYGMPILADYPTKFFGIDFPGNLDFEESKSIKVIAIKRGTLFEKKLPTDSAPQQDSQFKLKAANLERLKKFCEQEDITISDYRNFAIVEYYLPPNRNMYVLGTVTENPNAQNNMLITKGQYVDLLYLSDKPGEEIANRLGKRAKNWIIYGGIIAAASLLVMFLERDIVFGSGLPVTIIMALAFILFILGKGMKALNIIGKVLVGKPKKNTPFNFLFIIIGIFLFLFLMLTIIILSTYDSSLKEKSDALIVIGILSIIVAFIFRKGFKAWKSKSSDSFKYS